MSFKYGISTLALAAALIATPPAFAQLGISIGGDDGINVGVDVNTRDGLDVGADVGVGGDDGINAGADVGVGGDSGVNVGADVDVGGDDGIGVDADVGVGGRDNDDDSGSRRSLIDANVGIGTGGSNNDGGSSSGGGLVDLDVNVGGDGPLVNLDGGNGGASQSSANLVEANVDVGGPTIGGSNLLGLGNEARGGALVELIATANLGDLNLDDLVDDQRVIIVDIGDDFSDATLAEIEVALGSGNSAGTDETRAAISASVELSGVLANNGLSADDVLAIQIGSQGETYVYILPQLNDGVDVIADVDAVGVDVADLDASLLDDDAVGDVDLDILPGSGINTGDEPLVDVDSDIGLGNRDLAQVDLELLGPDSLVSGNLVILPGTGGDGGDDGGDDDGTPGGGDDDDGTPGNGDDDDGTPGNGDDDDGTPGNGDDDDGMPGNGDDDDGTPGNGDDDGTPGNGDDDNGMPGGGSNDDDDDMGNGGNNGGTGGTGGTGTGGGTVGTTPAGGMTDGAMVTTMQCPAEIRPFLEATADAQAVRGATEAEIVILTACPTGGLFETADFSPLRALLTALPVTQEAIASADITIDDVVSATVSGETVTIFALE